MSNFSFSHSVFKRLVSQGRQKVLFCGNGLMLCLILSAPYITSKSSTTENTIHCNQEEFLPHGLGCVSGQNRSKIRLQSKGEKNPKNRTYHPPFSSFVDQALKSVTYSWVIPKQVFDYCHHSIRLFKDFLKLKV